jgi:hypothetical protein
MGSTLRSGHPLVKLALLPLLGLTGPALAASPSTAPAQSAAPAAVTQPSSAPLPGPSSTPSLGQALKPSSPEQLALADHLRQRGAIFYGAYWCTHCFRQKNLFGQQAGDRLPYVECAKDQAGADKCNAAHVEAYPTWVLGTERREGVQTLEELAIWSGFKSPGSFTAPKGNAQGGTAPATSQP